jgi:hypothetical protein
MPRFARLSLAAAFAAVVLALAVPLAGGPSPARVTTDTAEYCDTLRARVESMLRARAGSAPSDASQLTAEGTRLCDRGEARGGILRLRQAIVLIARTEPTP